MKTVELALGISDLGDTADEIRQVKDGNLTRVNLDS